MWLDNVVYWVRGYGWFDMAWNEDRFVEHVLFAMTHGDSMRERTFFIWICLQKTLPEYRYTMIYICLEQEKPPIDKCSLTQMNNIQSPFVSPDLNTSHATPGVSFQGVEC